jgi:DNA-binding transcriptional ArsR family regulator
VKDKIFNRMVDNRRRLIIFNRMVEQSVALDHVFRALSDSTRRALLRALATGERNIGELAAPFRMSFAAVSKHVKVLEKAGLVRRRVQGRTHFCTIEAAPLAAAEQWLRYYQRFWAERLQALEALLDAEETTNLANERKGQRTSLKQPV